MSDLISAASKENRLDKAKQMLEEMCSAGTKVSIWSAEKTFTVEHHMGTQNARILATSSASVEPSVRTVYRSQKPAVIMVWAAVTSDDTKTRLGHHWGAIKVNIHVDAVIFEEHVLISASDTCPGG